ncbi:hypothetical protein D082_07120 [Synechocystis sp. PCC 6714]|nr:hypothetical protein D082_07120 [Synechocystis sp. PCC 6714]
MSSYPDPIIRGFGNVPLPPAIWRSPLIPIKVPPLENPH